MATTQHGHIQSNERCSGDFGSTLFLKSRSIEHQHEDSRQLRRSRFSSEKKFRQRQSIWETGRTAAAKENKNKKGGSEFTLDCVTSSWAREEYRHCACGAIDTVSTHQQIRPGGLITCKVGQRLQARRRKNLLHDLHCQRLLLSIAPSINKIDSISCLRHPI